MPPKRSAMAQELRDAFTENESLAEVEKWSATYIAQLQKYVAAVQASHQDVFQSATKYAAPTAAAVTQTPENIVKLLQEYQAMAHAIYVSAETIRTVIAVRVPELKEEDNLGVAVQMAVLRQLDGIQNKLLGSNAGGSDREGGSSGANTAAGMYIAREYLSARSDVEAKILGSGGEKKEGKGEAPVAPSLLRQLQQVDADFLLKAELAATQTATQLRTFINTYALNWKKLIQPRNATGGGMVS